MVRRLECHCAARVTVALTRLSQANFSNVEGVGGGVYELKIDFGSGYRVYFGKDGALVMILLGWSTKKRQKATIGAVQVLWADYRRGKSAKEH
jgi:putative addiction module killer protein